MTAGPNSRLHFARLPDVPIDTIVDHMSDPRVAEHMPLSNGGWNRHTAAKFLATKEQHWCRDGLGHWAIFAGDRYVGWGGFQKEGEEWDFGLVLRSDAFGLGPCVVRMAIDFAINDERIPFVTFLVAPSRKRLRALERLGATYVGKQDYNDVEFLKFRLETR